MAGKKKNETSAVRLNALDKVVSWFSPQKGAQRAYHRYCLSQLSHRYFEGASKTERTKAWRRPGTSASSAQYGQLAPLRNMSRNLTRNNPYAEKALRTLTSNVVGAGITQQLRDTADNKKRLEEIEALWWYWAETKACDADGLHDFAGLQALCMRTMAESGEVLIRRRRRRLTDARILPFQVQILEPDFLDETRDGVLPNGNVVVQGVEFDSIDQRVAYYLYETHPGDHVSFRSTKSNRIPAKDIIHQFEVKRPGQVRGYPWIAPVVVRLQEFDQYEDAQLVKQRVSAAWAAFVHDMQPPANATGLDRLSTQASENDAAKPVEYLQPGVIEYLPPGKEIAFASPPSVTGYGEYSLNVLRAIAGGYGVPYEALTGDFSNVNFSSGRMGWLEFQRNIESWQNHLLIGQLCEGIWGWFDEAAQLLGHDTSALEVKWVPPRREMIDPVAETKAAKETVRAGFTSWSRKVKEFGLDPDEVLAEIAKDNEKFDQLKIIVESDARVPEKPVGRPEST